MTVRSYACKKTRAFDVEGACPKSWEAFHAVAKRKLDMLNAAVNLEDLKAPPGNRLEPLKGDRKGQHSVRINDQWRICFRWTVDGPHDVEIADYH